MGKSIKGFDPRFEAADQTANAFARVVLITGGAGFIGSNLSRRLLDAGDRVICVDNLETGRYENISALMSNPSFRFFEHDIVEPFSISGRIDRIYNLACPASPPKYQIDPVHTLLTSVVGAVNLLDV
ncbi:GDP-mannose 4,6-dehydratase [Thalassovita sp.]|uniref:GDP-mannose 4,6-dehydratase n=1 Tax=Thalassovita sp. TaxID=1979401 RepID=UPI003B592ED0